MATYFGVAPEATILARLCLTALLTLRGRALGFVLALMTSVPSSLAQYPSLSGIGSNVWHVER